ncbi:MAG: PepSY domain-containing protein [Dongiaceae bacterium]
MKSRRKFLSLLLLPAIVGLMSEPAFADSSKKKKRKQNSQSGADECVIPGQCRSYGDYLDDLQGRYPGDQYLDGDEFDVGGRRLYRFRMLDPNGRVRDIGVDPNTGEWFDLP